MDYTPYSGHPEQIQARALLTLDQVAEAKRL
jgi:hypothetical protein